MKEKNECKLVKDLLENYSNDMKDITINDFIKNHIRQCESCKVTLEEEIKQKGINNKDTSIKRRKK